MFKEKKIKAKIPLHTLGCKGVALLSIIVILFSCFSFSVIGEESVTTVINPYNYNFGGFKIDYLMLSVYNSEGERVGVDFKIWQPSPTSRMEIYADLTEGNFLPNEIYRVNISMSVDSSLISTNNYTVGSFDVSSWDYYYSISNLVNAKRLGYNDDGVLSHSDNASYTSTEVESGITGYNVKYKAGKLGLRYTTYNVSVDCKINKERDVLGIFFYNFDFKQLSPSENAVFESQEIEKEEASGSGNSAIDDLTSAVPDYSGNIIQSFAKLANQVMHEQATCQITVPQIKVPKVANYFPDIVLLEEQQIKFEDYLQYIPEMLLFLVRAVFSAALVIFCCREIYGIFEYIMTMRGGNNG